MLRPRRGALFPSGSVGVEECQRERPSLCGRHRIVTRARIAEKSVISFREFHVHMILSCVSQSIRYRTSLIHCNVLVPPSPEKQDRGLQILYAIQQARIRRIRSNAAAVERNRAFQRQRDRRQKRGSASHAEAGRRDGSACGNTIGTQPIVRGSKISFHVWVAQFLHMRHARCEVVVPALESSPGAMEKLGRCSQKSFSREAFGNVADMRVDTESFLHDQQTAYSQRASRTRHV